MRLTDLNSMQGWSLNGGVSDLVVERCYGRYNRLTYKSSTEADSFEPMFFVAVYKSGDKYYLALELAEDSPTVNIMIDDDVCPNDGCVQLDSKQAEAMIAKLSQLGAEYFDCQMTDFDEVFSSIASIVSSSCPTFFNISYSENGSFCHDPIQICVARNQSCFSALHALLHEYTHFLCFKNGDKHLVPKTLGEYGLDTQENICDYVAYHVLRAIEPDYCNSLEDDLEKRVSETLETGRICEEIVDSSIIAGDIKANILLSANKKYLEKGQQIVKQILSQLSMQDCAKSGDNDGAVAFKQCGLVKLSPKDNELLYKMIMEEISPLLSEEFDTD